MKLPTPLSFAAATLLVSCVTASGGCASKGPAERAGRGLDRGVQGAKDFVMPPGPAEKAGRAVDRVINP